MLLVFSWDLVCIEIGLSVSIPVILSQKIFHSEILPQDVFSRLDTCPSLHGVHVPTPSESLTSFTGHDVHSVSSSLRYIPTEQASEEWQCNMITRRNLCSQISNILRGITRYSALRCKLDPDVSAREVHWGTRSEHYLPHFVLFSLATVPAAQAVQEKAPSVLIKFVPHLVQEDMSEFLYVPAGQLTEEC